MSNKYDHGDKVPSDVLCKRLIELARAVTKGKNSIDREFDMRVPAELDRDADLVLSASARRIMDLEKMMWDFVRGKTDKGVMTAYFQGGA